MDNTIIAWIGAAAAFVAILSGFAGAAIGTYSSGGKAEKRESQQESRLDALQERWLVADARFLKHEEHVTKVIERLEREMRDTESVVVRLDAKLDAIRESVELQRQDLREFIQVSAEQTGRRKT